MMIDEDTFFEPREAKAVTVPWTIFPVIIVLSLIMGISGGYLLWGRGGGHVPDDTLTPVIEATTPEATTEATTEPVTEEVIDYTVTIPFAPIYVVQNGTFADSRHLQNLVDKLSDAGYPAVTQQMDKLTRVFSGAYLTRAEAETRAGEMQDKNFDTFIKNIDHLEGGNFVIEAADEHEFILLTNIANFIGDIYNILRLPTVEPADIEVLPFIEHTTGERFDAVYNDIANIYGVLKAEDYTSEQYRTEIAWRLMEVLIDINLTQ